MNKDELKNKVDRIMWKAGVFALDREEVLKAIDQLDEPEKVVIPSFVAEWYEENIEGGYVAGDKKFSGNNVFRVVQDVIKVQNDETTWEDFAVDEKITEFACENEEVFLHLLVNCSYKNGYTVEEKKYIIKLDDESYLQRYEIDNKNIVTPFRIVGHLKEIAIKFDNEERAEKVAELVEGKVEELEE